MGVVNFEPPINVKARRVIDAISESLGMVPDPWPSDEDLDALVAGQTVHRASLAPDVFESVKRELEHFGLLQAADSVAPDLLAALKASRGQWIHSVNAEQCLAAIAKAEAVAAVDPVGSDAVADQRPRA